MNAANDRSACSLLRIFQSYIHTCLYLSLSKRKPADIIAIEYSDKIQSLYD